MIQNILINSPFHHRPRQEGHQLFLDPHRTGTRTAAAMRDAEGFVQIKVHHIKAHVTGAGLAHNGIHIGPVIIEQSAGLMDNLGYFDNGGFVDNIQTGRNDVDWDRTFSARRQELLGKGVLVPHPEGGFIFTADQLFNSPSLAASLVAGNNRSGLDAWQNSAGYTLKQSGFGKKTS